MNKKMKCGFSIECSTILSPNRVLTTLKSASFEIRILYVVHHSQTFVWEGKFQVEISDRCIACHLAKLLQMEHGIHKKINASHVSMLSSFVTTWQDDTKDDSIHRKSTHRMSECYLSSFVIILQRLYSPKRRFGTDEPTFRSPKTHSEQSVIPSKIFVLGWTTFWKA
jgi:hypothetical protein